jgi:uncharacterized protein (TIGR02217 family)
MAFYEERLLDCIAYGLIGGPTFNTRKVAMRNGRVLRNAQRSRPLYRYAARYQNIDESNHEAVVAAFIVCQGACHGFRWWDRTDYQATAEVIGVATGASQTLQLVKTYSFSTGDVVRNIRKPRTGTVTMLANGVSFAPSSIDYTTGMVTFTRPVGQTIAWTGEFDVPVTFESDEFPASVDNRVNGGYRLNADFAIVEDLTA